MPTGTSAPVRTRTTIEPQPIAGGQLAGAHRETQRVGDVDLDIGLRQVRRQPRGFSGARHGVPVIAYPPGVEDQREFLRDGVFGQRAASAR